MYRRILSALVVACAAVIVSNAVSAQDFPNRAITIIVPQPPGGGTDIISRIVAQQLSLQLGKPVVVENKPGAGTLVGTDAAAKAAPDGYTLLAGLTANMAVNPSLFKTLSYDPIRDFVPVGMMAEFPFVLVVSNNFPAKSVKELLALAKAKPGEINFASAGNGTGQHLSAELFKLMAGVDIVHVPFRGAGPALIDVMGGDSQMSFASVPSTIAHVRSGKLRAIGVGGLKRSFALPDVPTIDQSGVPGYQCANWIGLVAPAGTPEPIIARLHRELTAMQDGPELQKQFAHEGAEEVRMSSAEFGAFIASELAKWGKVVKDAGIKPQ